MYLNTKLFWFFNGEFKCYRWLWYWIYLLLYDSLHGTTNKHRYREWSFNGRC